MTKPAPPRLFDPGRVTHNRDRAAPGFGDYAFLKQRESSHLVDRLADVSRPFPSALDIGSHGGQAAAALLKRGQVNHVTSLEPSPKFCARAAIDNETIACGSLEHLSFDKASFDLVTSVLSLHWVNDLPGLLVQAKNVLKPDGLFLACLFGGGTLTELRACLIEAETDIMGGASPRISPLPGLQDMAGLMQRASFALPVADVDHITVRYDNALKLMQDLRGMGEQAAFAVREGKPGRPLSRRIVQRAAELYRQRFADPDGRIRASFEIIWLSGWAPAAGQPKPLRPGSARASLADAVRASKKR